MQSCFCDSKISVLVMYLHQTSILAEPASSSYWDKFLSKWHCRKGLHCQKDNARFIICPEHCARIWKMLLSILLIKKRYFHWVMRRPTLKSEKFQHFKISFHFKLDFWNVSIQKVFLVVAKYYASQNMCLLQYLSLQWTFVNYYHEKESNWIIFLFH